MTPVAVTCRTRGFWKKPPVDVFPPLTAGDPVGLVKLEVMFTIAKVVTIL